MIVLGWEIALLLGSFAVLLSGDMGSIDPPNPLMGIVAQILSQSLEKPSLTAPTQGEDGKFVKKVIEKIS